VDPEQFFGASRLVIVAGKGGVGKTTVSAALAAALGLGESPEQLPVKSLQEYHAR